MAAPLTTNFKSKHKSHEFLYTQPFRVEPNNISDMQSLLKSQEPGSFGSFIFESLQGYGGIFPMKKGYIKEAAALIRGQGGIVISDEVQAGLGRLGESFWGCQLPENDIIPDMIIFGKGISSGTVPLSGVVMKSSIANEVASEKMWISTYGNHAVASAAALEVLKIIEETDTQANVKELGKVMR